MSLSPPTPSYYWLLRSKSKWRRNWLIWAVEDRKRLNVVLVVLCFLWMYHTKSWYLSYELLIQKVPDDANTISKPTFLSIVISISKHCHHLYSKHQARQIGNRPSNSLSFLGAVKSVKRDEVVPYLRPRLSLRYCYSTHFRQRIFSKLTTVKYS